jgi:hypothetical protein
MTDELIEQVIWRDVSSGRYHLAARVGGKVYLTPEADNLDEAGEHEILEDLPEGVDDRLLCERCFGSRGEKPTLNTRGPR